MLPRTTRRRMTTNLKSMNNQKLQKSKLHGILTTKELKKKSARTTRPVRRTAGADSEKRGKAAEGRGWLPSSVGCTGWTDLRGKLRLRADCGLRLGLPRVGDTSSLT